VIARAARQARFPARFQLVAAMNPCPCGHLGDPLATCRCTPDRVAAYRGRISGPLLDRIDLHVDVPRVRPEEVMSTQAAEPSAYVAERVLAARSRQLQRQRRANARVAGVDVLAVCGADHDALAFLERAMHRLSLSARAYHRVLRVARTIADLAQCDTVRRDHVAEAVSFRNLDRRIGGTPISA
jgi:magnesium chelatase family protein